MKTFQQYVESQRIAYQGLPQAAPGPEAVRDQEITALKGARMVPGDPRYGRLAGLLNDKNAADAPPPKGEPYVGLPKAPHEQRAERLADLRNRSRSLSPEERSELSQLLQSQADADAPPEPAAPYQRMPDHGGLQRDQEIEALRGKRYKNIEDRIRLSHLLDQKAKEDREYDAARG